MQNVENERRGLREVKVNTFQSPQKLNIKPDVVQQKVNTKTSELEKDLETLKQENMTLIHELAESQRIMKLQKETNQLLLQKIKKLEEENSTVHIHSHKGIFWNDEVSN